MYPSDRTGDGRPQDGAYREATAAAGLYTAEPLAADSDAPRARTLREQGLPKSRIDDILVNCGPAATHAYTRVHALTEDWATYHNLLEAHVPWRDLGLFPAPALAESTRPAGQRVLCWPIKADKWQKFVSAFAGESAATFGALEQQITELMHKQVLPHWQHLEGDGDLAALRQTLKELGGRQAKEVVSEMAEAVMRVLARGQDLMMEICPTRPLNPEGKHYRPRQVNKRYMRLKAAGALARQMLADVAANGPLELGPGTTITGTLGVHLTMAGWDNTKPPAPDELRAAIKSTKAAIHKIDKEHKTQARQRAEKAAKRRAAEAPKLSNRTATDKHKPRNPAELKVLRDPDTGGVVTQPSLIQNLVERFITGKAAPPSPKTGNYDGTLPRRYPWEQSRQKDDFKGLEQPQTGRTWLHYKIGDKHLFNECMRELKNKKAPGPDGITNEVLKALPPSGRRALHGLMQVMWATACTPDCLKPTSTVLAHKKDSMLDLGNYRRLGLENTVLKL